VNEPNVKAMLANSEQAQKQLVQRLEAVQTEINRVEGHRAQLLQQQNQLVTAIQQSVAAIGAFSLALGLEPPPNALPFDPKPVAK
jgi:uncharacterized protein YoxC